MKPSQFAYHAPSTLGEVLHLLQDYQEEDVRVIAGGQSLLPLMNFRLAQPGVLVDLRRVRSLAVIGTDGSALTIGAMVRQSDAEHSADVASRAPLIVEALGYVAHPTVRHSGTIGGSVAHADPSAELPAVVLALQAELVVEGPTGVRSVLADDFFEGPFSTVIEPEEILAAIRITRSWQSQAFVEFARTHGSFALAGVGTCLDIEAGIVQAVSIGMSGVGPTPLRARAAEAALLGVEPTPDAICAAAEAEVATLSPAADIHATTAARISITKDCLRRSIQIAVDRAKEGM